MARPARAAGKCAQGNATTEDGAYTITPAGIAANSITRNGGASIFLTSEDEWEWNEATTGGSNRAV